MELNVFSLKNFYNPNYFERIKTNRILEKNYKKYFLEQGCDGFNYPILDDAEFFNKLYDKFLAKCAKKFGSFTIHPDNKKTCYCYRSNANDNISVRHNHIDTSVINGVYYYQVSKGDSISFFIENHEEKYYPK